MEPTLETEEPKEGVCHSEHASVVPVIPSSGNKASIRISSDMDQYMTNIQDQFQRYSSGNNKSEKNISNCSNGVTIVQSSQSPGGTHVTSSSGQCPVVVTVSGAVDQGSQEVTRRQSEEMSAGKVDITAHL